MVLLVSHLKEEFRVKVWLIDNIYSRIVRLENKKQLDRLEFVKSN